MSIQIQGAHSVSATSVQSVDVQTMLLTVQNQRATLLEGQLRGQLETVTTKNQSIGMANEQLGAKRSALARLEASNVAGQAGLGELKLMKEQLQQVVNRDPNGWTGLSYGWGGDDAAKSHEMLQRVKAQGLSGTNLTKDIDGNGTMDASAATVKNWIKQLDAKIAAIEAKPALIAAAKAEMDKIKSGIDSMSNSQQMDMLRLQSLSNKRNEAFEIMTNFMKKMQDQLSSMIGNIR